MGCARSARLKKRRDFDTVFKRGVSATDRFLRLTAFYDETRAESGHRTRFGISVGRKVGNSVTRNLLKRRVRECLRSLPVKQGADVVVTVWPEAASTDFSQLKKSIARLTKQSGIGVLAN